jgi:hypothetical protein
VSCCTAVAQHKPNTARNTHLLLQPYLDAEMASQLARTCLQFTLSTHSYDVISNILTSAAADTANAVYMVLQVARELQAQFEGFGDSPQAQFDEGSDTSRPRSDSDVARELQRQWDAEGVSIVPRPDSTVRSCEPEHCGANVVASCKQFVRAVSLYTVMLT